MSLRSPPTAVWEYQEELRRAIARSPAFSSLSPEARHEFYLRSRYGLASIHTKPLVDGGHLTERTYSSTTMDFFITLAVRLKIDFDAFPAEPVVERVQ